MIKKRMFKLTQLLSLISILFLISCGTAKEAFMNNKKNSTDEFLVKKKAPLVMPPNYGDLPIPKVDEDVKDESENDFKNLISKEDIDKELSEDKSKNKNLEESLLDKIKNN